mmetsp:Transcript_4329/g.8689  ORF Transcript_4329/g.8689 Transcript_4329/m.8689 type:complete len:345 (-) Transcript_4329:1692-2726(-)
MAARGPDSSSKKGGGEEGNRYDSSLAQLTRRFVNLLEEAPNGEVDLNNAAQQLNVPKRRIYDITNVLEGIQLIEKKSKNIIQWKSGGSGIASTSQESYEVLEREQTRLNNEISVIQSLINKTNGLLQDQFEKSKDHLYITYSDFKDTGLMESKTLIAIKAPNGANLEIPDPEEMEEQGSGEEEQRGAFEMHIHSPHGAIDVFLVDSGKPLKSEKEDDELTTAGSDEEELEEFRAMGGDELRAGQSKRSRDDGGLGDSLRQRNVRPRRGKAADGVGPDVLNGVKEEECGVSRTAGLVESVSDGIKPRNGGRAFKKVGGAEETGVDPFSQLHSGEGITDFFGGNPQ